jgi:Uncharacterized conserved protein (DUF2196)
VGNSLPSTANTQRNEERDEKDRCGPRHECSRSREAESDHRGVVLRCRLIMTKPVQDVLTNSREHHRGIKVRLTNGTVGRVSFGLLLRRCSLLFSQFCLDVPLIPMRELPLRCL